MHRKPKATVYVEFNFHTKNRNFSEQTKKVVPSQNFLKTQKQNRKFLPLPWRQTTLLPSSLLRLGGAPLAFPPALSPAPPRCGGVGVARRCFSWTSRGTATEAKSRARSLRPSCGSLRWRGSAALQPPSAVVVVSSLVPRQRARGDVATEAVGTAARPSAEGRASAEGEAGRGDIAAGTDRRASANLPRTQSAPHPSGRAAPPDAAAGRGPAAAAAKG